MDPNSKNEEGWRSRQFNRLEKRWSNLSLQQQRIATLAAIALLESCLVYCCWVADTRGQSAPVIHIGVLRVMAMTGIFICALLNAPLLAFIQDKISIRTKTVGRRLKAPLSRTANRLKRNIPPLTQAHGFYTVGCDAEARTLTEQVLAQEPENVTAQELLQFLDARQVYSSPEEEAKLSLMDKVLYGIFEKVEKSEYTPVVLTGLAVVTALLSLIQCLRYAYMGVTQGWNTTAWSGTNKAGELQFHPFWESVLMFALWPALVSYGLLFIFYHDPIENLLKRGAKLCHAISDWGRSRLNVIRNFVSPTARSMPSRSSGPKASPASRPSSTTRTRRHR